MVDGGVISKKMDGFGGPTELAEQRSGGWEVQMTNVAACLRISASGGFIFQDQSC